jgi:integrase
VPKVALSDIGLQSLKAPASGHTDYWDASFKGGAFGCRVSPKGTKTFILKIDNARRSLGRYPIVKLADARTAAKRILAERTLGRLRPEATTYAAACALYIEDCRRKNKTSTVAEYERLLGRLSFTGQLAHISPAEAGRQVARIKSPSERFHVVVAGRVFFNWAKKRHYIERNPFDGIIAAKSPRRSHIISDLDLKRIWVACNSGSEELPVHYPVIVKLLILLGQRRGEIAALQADWIQRDTITLPGHITKNHEQHTFPTGQTAKDILAAQSQAGLLFPARGRTDRPFNGWSKSKKALDKLSGVTGWTLHDLRRKFRSTLGALGVAPHIGERLVNHISAQTEMERTYDLYRYLPEMRAAMEKWEAHLTFLLRNSPQITHRAA